MTDASALHPPWRDWPAPTVAILGLQGVGQELCTSHVLGMHLALGVGLQLPKKPSILWRAQGDNRNSL